MFHNKGDAENRGSNFNLIDLILLSKLGESRRQNGDRISILYSIFQKSTGYLVKMILAKTSLVMSMSPAIQTTCFTINQLGWERSWHSTDPQESII